MSMVFFTLFDVYTYCCRMPGSTAIKVRWPEWLTQSYCSSAAHLLISDHTEDDCIRNRCLERRAIHMHFKKRIEVALFDSQFLS